jgi:hypothetical protein
MPSEIYIDTWMREKATVGVLSYGDFRCLTLELPWHCNEPFVSCIPDGEYEAGFYQSPTRGKVIQLKDVPGRSYIQIHSGNYTRQIKGCILVGDSLTYLNGDDVLDVASSRATLGRLMNRITDDDIRVIITRK